jgi:hypothetical protein
MRDKAAKQVAPAKGWRRLRALIGLTIVALAGCFGAPAMHYDIQSYNKAIVSSEQQMLLFNIGRLNRKLPPHFMMLSSVSQTRMFSASASFQWSQTLSSVSVAKNTSELAQGGNWQAGPFAGGAVENPTITFVPIQGQDFAQRFESTLTDKFSVFSEDLSWSASREELADLVSLFAEGLYLTQGDSKVCKKGFYHNRRIHQDDLGDRAREPRYYIRDFSACVEDIATTSSLDVQQLDGDHPVPTSQAEDPKAADLVSALQAGYKWAKNGDKFALTTPVKMPAWFDFSPQFTGPSEPEKDDSPLPVFWTEPRPRRLDWKALQYNLPKGYQWKVYKSDKNDPNSSDIYALVPDGYDLDYYNGKLEYDRNGKPVLTKVKSKEPLRYVRFSYANKVVRKQWPFPYDMVYVEMRHGLVDNATAERLCFSRPDDSNQNGLICGYFKIGNLLQIMQRLADLACDSKDPNNLEEMGKYCSESIFGIGFKAPSWADTSAPFTDSDGVEKFVWVPAHDPQKEYLVANNAAHYAKNLAERDRKMFFTLYKLYQMSLVDTSKLVTGAPPITISK